MTTLKGKLDGKVAIITGASKGIGASTAKHLAESGAAVVVSHIRQFMNTHVPSVAKTR
jgi:NAD(P)-dependent dehydrogenase (short-subunit alcohol dehydrogenase family)